MSFKTYAGLLVLMLVGLVAGTEYATNWIDIKPADSGGVAPAEGRMFWNTSSQQVNVYDANLQPVGLDGRLACDYLVYTNGTHYFAKNCSTGVVEKSGADAESVIQAALDYTPTDGRIVFDGAFIFEGTWVNVTKPVTLIGGRFYRGLNVGNSHTFFAVGGGVGEPKLNGTVRFEGMFFDGRERLISSTYTEDADAPVHTAITLKKVQKVVIRNCEFYDMAREAIWITTVEGVLGTIEHDVVTITNNIFENVGYGITAESFGTLLVKGNVVRGLNSNGNLNNISYFVSMNYLDGKNLVVTNNLIDGRVPEGYPFAGSFGYVAFTTGGTIDIRHYLIGSNIVRNVQTAVLNTVNATISANRFSDLVVGVDVDNNNTIMGNVFLNFTNIGIRIEGTASQWAEYNQIIENVFDTPSASNAIVAQSYARLNIFYKNDIRGNYSDTPLKIYRDKNIVDALYGNAGITGLRDFLGNFTQKDGIYLVGFFNSTQGTYYLAVIDMYYKKVRLLNTSEL